MGFPRACAELRSVSVRGGAYALGRGAGAAVAKVAYEIWHNGEARREDDGRELNEPEIQRKFGLNRR